MTTGRRFWSGALLATGLVGCVAYLLVPMSATWGSTWYLVTAVLGTGMAVAGAILAAPGRRRVWVALAVGQGLYLVGDFYWVYAENVLNVLPYPSLGDAAYLLRYAACAAALCWLVRGRQAGRDRAAFLDAAILTSAFALPAVVFLVEPAVAGSEASLLSRVVATAYPIGDVLVLAVIVRLVLTPAARNRAFVSLIMGLVILLATDVYYMLLTSGGGLLPPWMDVAYAVSYLLIGFAALHPSASDLTEPSVHGAARPVVVKIVLLGGASLLPPLLGITLALAHAGPNPMVIAAGGAVSSLLVLVRLSDLLRESESQTVQLAALARTDGLTGVPNRRTWDHEIARASAVALAEGRVLTVAALDLDDFKRYNDTQGHLAGDLVLKETAAAWAQVLAGHGFLARCGGDEFVLLLPGTDAVGVHALLQRLHDTVAGNLTCSIGVTAWLPGEQSILAVARADAALYEAKRRGRNQTVRLGATPEEAGPGLPVGVPGIA